MSSSRAEVAAAAPAIAGSTSSANMSISKVPTSTLIVAVTPSFGIGRAGTLPWPRIKTEMAYFARVTKRSGIADNGGNGSDSPVRRKNAVVMGRKTWESIPTKFRPLAGRINVVISRRPGDVDTGRPGDDGKGNGKDDVLAASGLQEALELLHGRERAGELGHVFVIGGAQIYAEALKRADADRVLLTRISRDYECDTFFPVKFGSSDANAAGWAKTSEAERDEFLGENGVGDDDWSVELWKRI